MTSQQDDTEIFSRGFVKLHREFLTWEWYNDINISRLFIHCIIKSNFEDKKWRGIDIKRGSFITSIANLSEETGLSVSQTRTAIKKLELTNDIANTKGHNFSLISITNYEKYQRNDKLDDKSIANPSQIHDKLIATTKELKELKELIEKKEKKGGDGKPTKLSKDWKISEKEKQYALDKHWTEKEIANEVENFIDHFTNSPARNKSYVDWEKCWQGWVRRNLNKNGMNGSTPPSGSGLTDQQKIDAFGEDAVL